MTEMVDPAELLFFDTFSHESSEELNLDLVQFPKPVYVTEVRIIPLGARVQADFPGGVRLGATNPSQFTIEFFVNDLGKPGASTFESLGGFEYNQNGCIHLECINETTNRQIPTDGLVLRGWYTTITLAVYGTLTKNLAEQVLPQVVAQPAINQQPPPLMTDVQPIQTTQPLDNSWQQDVNINPVQIEYNQPPQPNVSYNAGYVQPDAYQQDYHHVEYYNAEPPKDPRYHHTPETEWDQKDHPRRNERIRDPEDPRDPERHYTRAVSRDRDRRPDYREASRDRDWDRERAPSMDPREREWDRGYKIQDNYKRSRDPYTRGISSDREEVRKRPRTPPMISPKRPHTPHGEKELSPGDVESISEDEINTNTIEKDKNDHLKAENIQKSHHPIPSEHINAENDQNQSMEMEEFEPILSDEDICDEMDNYQELEYDLSAYSNNDDIIKLFNPITSKIEKYYPKNYIDIPKEDPSTLKEKLEQIFSKLDEKIENLIEILTPCSNKYNTTDFKNFSPEIKEEYVHICEQIPPFLQNNPQFSLLVDTYTNVPEPILQTLNFYPTTKILIETLLSFVTIGLDFELALTQNQPPYKIRHIKNGVRLVEVCCTAANFISLMSKYKIDAYGALLGLFEREYMALSIKLLILKSLDSTLTEFGIDDFLNAKGYQNLVRILKSSNSVRVKFALNSLITKLNIYELLRSFKKNVFGLVEDEKRYNGFVLEALEQILTKYRRGNFEISQPKRFLPVSTQFEINKNEAGTKSILINFFRKHNLVECFLILLTHPTTNRSSAILTQIHEFLTTLTQSYDGILYLSENLPTVSLIIKCFLQQDDLDANYILSESIFIKSQSLGLSLAYKLQSFYYIQLLSDIKIKNFINDNVNEILEPLHSLFALTYVNVGKKSVAETLSLGDNIKIFIELLNFFMSKSEKDGDRLKKSPGVGYIVDLIHLTVVYSSNVRFLERYGKQILAVAYQSERFEAGSSNKLKEVSLYLKPLEIANVFSYDDIKPLCEIVKTNLDTITNFPPQILTSLRILCHLGISESEVNEILGETSDFVELKYKYVILQLFSLDGVSNLTTILQKVCDFYEQPSLHLSTFGSFQGYLVIETILPCVRLLRNMLANVIQCRNTDFRDLTSIPILLQTYNLANSFPQTSFVINQSKQVCEEVINTLLVYTQPISDEITENDSLNKTLWTLMVGEVVKYVTFAPYTFISGLLIFSELLPLPLPIQTKENLSETEVKRLVNLRKLWSAHLHPHALQIHEMITKLSNSVHQPLLHLLRRVCIQISDLAANSALMITRGILDSVLNSVTPKTEKVGLPILCTPNVSRLLHFLACLATHNAIKCAILQLLSNPTLIKVDEKYQGLLTIFCQILKTKNEISAHIQGQECVLNIIQNLCDAEITLVQNDVSKNEISSEIYLSNSLPSREVLLPLVSSLVDHFISENSFTTLLPCLRTFLLLTEHDYGFFYLCSVLEKKTSPFLTVFKRFVMIFSKDNHNLLQTLNTTLEFIKVCLSTDILEETNVIIAPRTMKISCKELKTWIGWKEIEEGTEKHPLYTLETLLKNCDTDLEALQSISESVSNILEKLNAPESDVSFERNEVLLPPSDTLLNQFACRPVYNLTDLTEDRLTTSYWLSSPQDESESESDLVPCDIMEIWRQNLPADLSLNREIERLLKICPTQDSNERIIEPIKTKRIIEQKDDKMKRPYVTPMRGRGFPRVPPQRGDLFRSRPPNTSRPPSLHVDDFVALETCGAQPTGPTGYNKISREILSTRVRSVRGRTFISPDRGMHFRPM